MCESYKNIKDLLAIIRVLEYNNITKNWRVENVKFYFRERSC